MRRSLRTWPKAVLIAALATQVAAGASGSEAAPETTPCDAPALTPGDKAELSEALRMQKTLGEEVWPGFARAEIAVILYNNRYDFLVGPGKALLPWLPVPNEQFGGEKYFRRNASKAQAFAVKLDGRWVASLTALDCMNHELPRKITRDFHVVAILHEMFHAYQATRSAKRFSKALGTYSAETAYPARDPEFAAGWDREGSLLAAALKAADRAAARRLSKEFLKARAARRAHVRLTSDLLAYERELEWLEGLGQYAEVRFYELAASHRDQPAYSKYRPGLPYWQSHLFLLERRLSQQSGDLRCYLSGMAQARLLDRLDPDWKNTALRRGVYLENLLRESSAADER